MLVKSTYVVARYSRTTIVDVLPYKASVESERREERWQQRMQRVGGMTEEGRVRVRGWPVSCLCCLFVLSSLLGEDVHRDRAAEGESPRRRFPPFEEAW